MQHFLENHKGEMVSLTRNGERKPIQGRIKNISGDVLILNTADGDAALRIGSIEMANILNGEKKREEFTQNMHSVKNEPALEKQAEKSSLVVPSLNMPGAAPVVRDR